jgi:hypothetical protein
MVMSRYRHGLFENLYAPIAKIRLKTGRGYVRWMIPGWDDDIIYTMLQS